MQHASGRELITWDGAMAAKLGRPRQTGGAEPAAYFCLDCRTMEVYHDPPAMQVPWHTHDGQQSLLQRVTERRAHALVARGIPVVHTQCQPEGRPDTRSIAWPVRVEGLPDSTGDRLAAVLAHVAEKGW